MILFKAKRTDNSEWIEGYYISTSSKEVCLIAYWDEDSGKLAFVHCDVPTLTVLIDGKEVKPENLGDVREYQNMIINICEWQAVLAQTGRIDVVVNEMQSLIEKLTKPIDGI